MIQQLPHMIQTNSFVFVNYTDISADDSRILWQARNDVRIRRYMENEEPFSWESHCKFVESLRFNTKRAYYAAYRPFAGGGIAVGAQYINPIDWGKFEVESGQYLLPEYQGKGIGSEMKKEFFEWLLNNGFKRITEKVKISNSRNQHVNEKLGMRIYGRDEKYIFYEYY